MIELNTPDSKWLRSCVRGLSYFDAATGESVLIAEVKDSTGELHGKNVVIYPDAFTDVQADLRYIYTLGGFEQDVIISSQLPAPEEFGMNSETTWLEVLTEFVGAPAPGKQTHASGGRADTDLNFGVMKIGRGKAFALGDKTDRHRSQPVIKSWEKLEGRDFLIEQVEWKAVKEELVKLPPRTALNPVPATSGTVKRLAAKSRMLPALRTAEKKGAKPFLVARADVAARPGYVLDYYVTLSGQTNFTFQGDTTYYISGWVTLSGTTILEGGTVIKYGTDSWPTIGLDSYAAPPILCKTSPYRHAVFTAVDDDSVGEGIEGSTGQPDGYYGMAAFDISGFNIVLRNVRFSYLSLVLNMSGGDSCEFENAQFVNCYSLRVNSGVYCTLKNVLVSEGYAAIYCAGGTLWGQNVTFHGLQNLAVGSVSAYLTNCLVVAVGDTNLYSLSGVSNVFLNSDAGVFQTVGAGSYYLADSSPYRDAGTMNISPELLADLRNKTTHPPLVYSNLTFSVATDFSPQAQRDTDTPDLGYHYDPLDHVFIGCQVQSALTFTAGTAAGWYVGGYVDGYIYQFTFGLLCSSNATVTFEGTATAPCWWTRFSNVQEGGNGNWPVQNLHNDGAGLMAFNSGSLNPQNSAQVVANFTRFAGTPTFDKFLQSWWPLTFRANSCEFYHGSCRNYFTTFALTNCSLFRSELGDIIGRTNFPGISLRHCTMYGGTLTAYHYPPYTNWPIWIEHCAFDGVNLHTWMNDYSGGNTNITYCDYNAFLTNAGRLPMLGAHDVIVTNFNWQSGPLGDFYLPADSPLVDMGSTTAADAGLSAYTIHTNQIADGDLVDIGCHYSILSAPTASDLNDQTCQNTPRNITLSGSSPNNPFVTYFILTDPTNGTLSGALPNPVYTANVSSFTGTDSFTYKVNDGFLDSAPATVTVIVGDQSIAADQQFVMTGTNRAVNINLKAISPLGCTNVFSYTITSGPTHGSLSGTGTNRTYTPNTGYEGEDSFTYTVSDGVWSNAPGTVTIYTVAAGTQLTTFCRPDRIVLNWTVDEATEQMLADFMSIRGFKIYRATSSGGPYTNVQTVLDGDARMWVDTNIATNQIYYYKMTFMVYHFSASGGIDPNIIYESPYSDISTNSTCDLPPGGPIDVAFIIDNTGSMLLDGAFISIQEAIPAVLNDIIISSSNDCRFALVTADDTVVNVRVSFTNDISVFTNALMSLTYGFGAGSPPPECTDECLYTVVNALPASGRTNNGCSADPPLQLNDFSPSFRTNANVRKLVVLITDVTPGEFCNAFNSDVEARAHQYAVDAKDQCIQINAIQVWDQSPEETEAVMRDYATTSCGWYERTVSAGTHIDDAILQMLYVPGACSCP